MWLDVILAAFKARSVVVVIALIFIAGCSNKPARVYQAEVDFVKVSAEILETYDLDKNGSVSKNEAKSLPALNKRFSNYDKNGDGNVDADEFQRHLKGVFDPKIGLLSAKCVVKQSGKPLADAKIRFVPESFLKDVIPSAEGKVRKNGFAILSINKEDLPPGAPTVRGLLRAGVYRVEITHPTKKIPAQYNTETTLGDDVAGYTVATGPLLFNL